MSGIAMKPTTQIHNTRRSGTLETTDFAELFISGNDNRPLFTFHVLVMAQLLAHPHTHTHRHTHTQTHTHTVRNRHTHKHKYSQTHSDKNSYKNTHTDKNSYKNTHSHTHA